MGAKSIAVFLYILTVTYKHNFYLELLIATVRFAER